MPQFVHIACQELGITQSQAGGIVIEALARITPDMTMSEMTLLKVLSEEIEAYRDDSGAYEARGAATTYDVLALKPDPPADLGALSPDILEILASTHVPRSATPQSEWWEYSLEVDGYNVAQRIGWELAELALSMIRHYQSTGEWRGSLLDLRLALFWNARALRHSDLAIEDAGADEIRKVASLLEAIASRTPTVN